MVIRVGKSAKRGSTRSLAYGMCLSAAKPFVAAVDTAGVAVEGRPKIPDIMLQSPLNFASETRRPKSVKKSTSVGRIYPCVLNI